MSVESSIRACANQHSGAAPSWPVTAALLGTAEQIASIRTGMEGKRLRYRMLIADNGLDSGARSMV